MRVTVARLGVVAIAAGALLALPALAAAGTPHGIVGHVGGALGTGGRVHAPVRGSFDDLDPTPGPMSYLGGHVMRATTVYTVYWTPTLGLPPGASYPSGYGTLVDQFVHDVAADAGSAVTSNVFSSLTQYSDFTGNITSAITNGGSLMDTNPFPVLDEVRTTSDPATSCSLPGGALDYCLTDAQLMSELTGFLTARGKPTGFGALYVLVLPSDVGVCAGLDTSTDPATPVCSSNDFCAYHSWTGPSDASPGYIYAIEPFFTPGQGCDLGDGEPNNNDADIAINTISHETSEAITDPAGEGWWQTSTGQENGDKCAWGFGTRLGNTGTGQFNQLINGHPYFLQREWSNASNGCYQFARARITSLVSGRAIAAGTSVVIGGSSFFGAGTGSSLAPPTVRFNDRPALSTVWSGPGQLTSTPPGGLGSSVVVSVDAIGGSARQALPLNRKHGAW